MVRTAVPTVRILLAVATVRLHVPCSGVYVTTVPVGTVYDCTIAQRTVPYGCTDRRSTRRTRALDYETKLTTP